MLAQCGNVSHRDIGQKQHSREQGMARGDRKLRMFWNGVDGKASETVDVLVSSMHEALL